MKNHRFSSLKKFGKFDDHRAETRVCPGCQKPLAAVGINRLAYTMDVCTCRTTAEYDHVVEQVWHKSCLVVYLTENPGDQDDYRVLPKKKAAK